MPVCCGPANLGLVGPDELAILDSTAHSLKFSGFQEMYFNDAFPAEFEIHADRTLANRPVEILSDEEKKGAVCAGVYPGCRGKRG